MLPYLWDNIYNRRVQPNHPIQQQFWIILVPPLEFGHRGRTPSASEIRCDCRPLVDWWLGGWVIVWSLGAEQLVDTAGTRARNTKNPSYFLRVIPRPETLVWHSFWHTIWKYIWHISSGLLSDILPGIYFDILSDILYGIYSDIFSGIHSGVWLRSDSAHWDLALAVEDEEEKRRRGEEAG